MRVRDRDCLIECLTDCARRASGIGTAALPAQIAWLDEAAQWLRAIPDVGQRAAWAWQLSQAAHPDPGHAMRLARWLSELAMRTE